MNSPLIPYLYISALLFAAGVYFYYRLAQRGDDIDRDKSDTYFKLLLAAGIVIRLIGAAVVEGFPVDINLFRFWSRKAAEDLLNIYNGDFFIDYPPFYIYFLFIIGKIAQWLSLGDHNPLYIVLLKLPSMAADIVSAVFLYRLGKNRLSDGWRLFISAIYLFNPAVIFDSAIWGQVDSLLTAMLAAGFLVLSSSRRPQLSSILFAAAAMTKPQGLVFLPVVLFALLKRRDWKLLMKTFLYGIAAGIIIILPFAVNKEPLWIFKLFFGTASGYPYVSFSPRYFL
jgi:Gpi18-like mannosyltransferase